MDEEELARRAVERRAITEEQLREARSFAEGGRSLLSVLLDLGYLRVNRLPELLEAPSAPPAPVRRRIPSLPRLIFLVLVSFLLGWFCGPRTRPNGDPELRRENEKLRRALDLAEREKAELQAARPLPPPRPPSKLRPRGRAFLEEAETGTRERGGLSPESRDLFLKGATLLEAAASEEPLEEPEELMLGRAWEFLQNWGQAYEAYARILRKNPQNPRALLGAARTALETGDLPAALRHAGEAVRRAPSGEAHLLHGRAEMRSGRKDLARQDFLKARELDPSLTPLVANLLERLPRE